MYEWGINQGAMEGLYAQIGTARPAKAEADIRCKDGAKRLTMRGRAQEGAKQTGI